jgi:hypothetical protein
MTKLPRARTDQLLVQELTDETLVYDLERNRAHCLNRSAALIWKRCDGKTSIRDISRSVSRELESRIDERTVWYAISQFNKDQLLMEELPLPGTAAKSMNRRQMVRTLGVAAAVAVPLVTSIVAPTAVQAVSCLPTGDACTGGAQCCSGSCNNGTCL